MIGSAVDEHAKAILSRSRRLVSSQIPAFRSSASRFNHTSKRSSVTADISFGRARAATSRSRKSPCIVAGVLSRIAPRSKPRLQSVTATPFVSFRFGVKSDDVFLLAAWMCGDQNPCPSYFLRPRFELNFR